MSQYQTDVAKEEQDQTYYDTPEEAEPEYVVPEAKSQEGGSGYESEVEEEAAVDKYDELAERLDDEDVLSETTDATQDGAGGQLLQMETTEKQLTEKYEEELAEKEGDFDQESSEEEQPEAFQQARTEAFEESHFEMKQELIESQQEEAHTRYYESHIAFEEQTELSRDFADETAAQEEHVLVESTEPSADVTEQKSTEEGFEKATYQQEEEQATLIDFEAETRQERFSEEYSYTESAHFTQEQRTETYLETHINQQETLLEEATIYGVNIQKDLFGTDDMGGAEGFSQQVEEDKEDKAMSRSGESTEAQMASSGEGLLAEPYPREYDIMAISGATEGEPDREPDYTDMFEGHAEGEAYDHDDL